MKVWKEILGGLLGLTALMVGIYGLFLYGGGNLGRAGEGGLASPEVRSIIVLSLTGGSAFITGFGLRDVIGRVTASRQRSRLKSIGAQAKH